jgi:hypothetical protein
VDEGSGSEGWGRGEPSVRDLFRRAVARSDAAAMRTGVERMLGLTDGGSLSPDAEFELRHPAFVMEMPQSGERVRGRAAMREMQQAFPTPPQSMILRRVVGAGHVWVVEGEVNYGADPWRAVVVLELDADGSILRETRYYVQSSEAPAWRSGWVEPID